MVVASLGHVLCTRVVAEAAVVAGQIAYSACSTDNIDDMCSDTCIVLCGHDALSLNHNISFDNNDTRGGIAFWLRFQVRSSPNKVQSIHTKR